MKRVLRNTGAALSLLLAAAAFAQTTPEVSYSENFQSYKTQSNPPGWIDTAVGNPRPEALGLYKTWPEPLDNKSANVVFGTKQASGTPEGRNPRIGAFSTLGAYEFTGAGRFEYRGRVIRTHADARVGLTFFSSYPQADRYYLIGLWSQAASASLTMQLFGFGSGTPAGTVDSNTSLEPNKWYRFLIQVDDAEGATKIRARFWLDGTTEPETFSIDATDAGASRLRSGRIGLWTAVRGEAYIDDLTAKSPVDHSAPVIKLFESGQPLLDGAKFNRDATPEIRVSDDLSAATYTATLDGAPYTSLTPVTTDGWHVLAVTAVDGPRNVSTLQINFLVDKTAPVVTLHEGLNPLVAGALFNRDVTINATVADVSETTLAATLDGQLYTLGTLISSEGQHSITVEATDAVGWKTTVGPVAFTVDKTAPHLSVTSHTDNAVLTAANIVLAGNADDAIAVTVNGLAAVVDPVAKTFTINLSLLEGENVLAIAGTDKAGNPGSASLRLQLDTRPPAITVNVPAADACIDTAALQVSGTASDARLDSVKVTIGATTVAATVDASGHFTAGVPVEEGKAFITIEAADRVAHTASASRSVTIDRTAPAIEIRENGDLFAGGIVNRAVALFVKAEGATVTATLDGSTYSSGTSIGAEGTHTLAVSATDCAGHKSDKSVEFTINLTAPAIRDVAPANGGTVGTMPSALTGRTDTDVTSVSIVGTNISAAPDGSGAFTLDPHFVEGLNRFTLEAVDNAGNRGSLDYSLTIKTSAPIVEIRESGSPIAANALYSRAVTPAIRSVDPSATIAATLNGAAYTSGTTITADGSYTLHATATDALGHTGTAEATFTIDRTPPVVTISEPVASTVQSEVVRVRGDAGDSIAASLNGQPLTLAADGSFTFENFALEVGGNALVVVGHDRAGNAGRAEVLVTRDDLGAGVLLTYPPDRSRTNRPSTDVTGRVLTPGKGTLVAVGTTPVDADPTGLFRLSGYALTEGENTITVTATATNGAKTTASVRVTADFTPPSLTVLESGQPLADGARLAERAVISLQSSDSAGTVVNELTIDGVKVAAPFTIATAGGHSIIAVARDLAGNETRAERTLYIGATGGAAGCSLDGFDPADGAVILSNSVQLIGRSGGAIGVKVNGVRASMADGSFSAGVELPNEGPNAVAITCTDADGNPTGTAKTITLVRVTGDPSISISTPAEDFVSAAETITVTGTVGQGVVSADVNGVAATITGSTFTAANVRLAPGLNLLVAHARNAGGRIGTASRRGVYLKDAPVISISAPSAGAVTGIPTITVSGTFTNLDPATLVVTNLANGATFNADATRLSDTTGSFTAGVSLTSGDQTLRVSGRDRLNRAATATVAVRLTSGTPGITITQPEAHAYFGGGSETFTVGGTFSAAAGSLIDVNGVNATVTGTSYSANVKFSTLAGGITPVVARVTQPDGASATASTIVTQLAAAPTVVETFPAANAVEVDTGALLLVLFSQPMDRASLDGAFRLEDANGNPVSGSLWLDKDVLTFAPSTLLAPGARYTIRVSTAAKNLAGTALASAASAGFTTAPTAPATPPAVTAPAAAVCGQSLLLNGTAAPGARLRLEAGTLTLSATAGTDGAFSFTYPLSGQSGFLVLRVRVVGSDGSVSPATDVTVRVDCSGPQVLGAAFDRSVNKLTIQFSESIDPATVNVGSAIVLTLDDGRSVAGTATTSGNLVSVTPAESLAAKTFSVSVDTTVKDTIGNNLVAPFSQTFTAAGTDPVAGDGSGFISGEVYDATTGRPLAGAQLTIVLPAGAVISSSADSRGRYLARLREGAHTIKASLTGYTSVWRQIVVPPGAGAIPIDIRLTRRGESTTSGGDTAVTRRVELTSAPLPNGRKVAVTSIGGQALIGLLPLGWSPIAAAEVSVDGTEEATPLAGAQLTFTVPGAAVTAAAQNLAAVQYDAVRDEWRVLASTVIVANDKAVVSIQTAGAYALVYPDKAAGLTQPPLPVAGDVLGGVPAAPSTVELTKRDFTLDPPIVLPTGRTVATLRIEGAGVTFPSGTAVQAYIDEELRLADGSRLLDPPFATDLLLYRTLAGDLGVADFHLAPSTRAAEVILEIGVDRIRVFPYPGRLDRGTLIGPEGGRVPADDKVAIEIATGAVSDPLRATATSLSAADLAGIGTVAGFRVVGGFQLTLQRATESAPSDIDGDGVADALAPPELFIPARATFSVDASKMPAPTAQVILAELLDSTPYGRMVRLAVPMMLVDPTQTGTPALRFTTATIDRSILPVDGVVHEGRYVLLAAEGPIAFATGTIRFGSASGRLLADARILAAPLGVAELSRATGIYNIPVPARPAAPFTLLPRHTTTGDGAVYTHAAAVDPAGVTRVDLALVPQPPVLGNVVVLKGEPPSQAILSTIGTTENVSLTTNIRASFTPAIDPASVTADSITVTDAATGKKVEGSATADGNVAVVWTIKTGDRLKPNSNYLVAVSASIRGANGANLARSASYSFSTVTEILNSEIHRERIRITIPENGLSRITGAAGALPAGWQAVAIRRNRDFLVRYQATAAGDGSFSFLVGDGGDPADRVTMADVIDLQVVSNIGNVAALFALTPFTSEDGKSFVVPAGAAIRYTSPDGFTLDVPEGAFDEATVIRMSPMAKEEFTSIPSYETENGYIGSVDIDFDGVAGKPLGLEVPLPAGFDAAGKTFVLAQKGMSPVGPRIALVDLMQARGGKLVIDHDNVTASAVVIDGRKAGAQQTLTGSKFSKYLMMLVRGGAYSYQDIKVYGVGGSVGFGVMQGLQTQYDFIWDLYWSYYIPHLHVAERGGAILPIISGRRFTVTGFDPGTGLQAVSRTYDPIPFGEPGTVSPIPSTEQNDGGPYPVYGGPYRVELLDLEIEDVDVESIRNFKVRLSRGTVAVSPGARPLDGDIKVTLINTSKGAMIQGTGGGGLSLPADAGNRIALLIEERRVDSKSPLSIVFSEPIYTGGSTDPAAVDTFLHDQIKVAYAPAVGDYYDITRQVRYSVDSGKRRVNITLPSALQSEARYRITLQPEIADIVDDAAGMKLAVGTRDVGGQKVPVGGGFPLELFFDVRKPAGSLNDFSAAPLGLIRGMELAGNVLFVAAQEGGLRSFDVSNPAASAPALGYIAGAAETGINHISVTVDRHNRVYTTAQLPASGIFRSYRVEDFAAGGPISVKGSKLINWKIGFAQGLGLPSNTMVSDIPESIPFRIKVILADDEQSFADRKKFVDGTGASEVADYPKDDLKRYRVIVPGGGDYKVQRITVENVTLDMRWSADAVGGGSATIDNVVARSTDRLRVIKNQKTYAIVAHLGYGIAVYDANAIEHNTYLRVPSNDPRHLREQLVLTNGLIGRDCPNPTPDYGIVENYITTDAELGNDTDGSLYSYSVDPYRGVLDLKLELPGDGALGTRDDTCEQRPSDNTGGLLFRTSPAGSEAPRMRAVRDAITSAAGREPIGHFGALARYHWAISAEDNKYGTRGFARGKAGERDYILVAGAEYGLIVVEVESNPAQLPRWPLKDANIADVIWIPGGVHTVRAYPSANVAVVGDRYGRAIIVDLSHIDERWDDRNNPYPSGVFPTLAKALQGVSDGYGIGGDDPRILWKSAPGVYLGAAAPVFDPLSGMVFAGNGTRVRAMAGVDPKVEMKVNLGEPGGLSTVGGVVPLGVPLPKNIEQKIAALPACDGSTIACKANASLAAFKLEVSLPGNVVDALTNSQNELRLAVESERIIDAVSEQTPAGFPRAHLRRTRRDGSSELSGRAATSFKFKRVVPEELRSVLKYQRGYNRFVSPWIIAIADPRAAEQYTWREAPTKEDKKNFGCDECERPEFLKRKTENDDVYELYTNGRYIAVRPEYKGGTQTIFAGTQYAYLGEEKRLLGRFSTVMADTVRPTDALVAGQHPPVAEGLLQDITLLHSGELQTTAVDINAGGRAGNDVLIDRAYRSRTLMGTAFGLGWDSTLLRRVRALPNGDAEYRDGAEVWRFRAATDGGFESPRGLFLKLSRTSRGWKMIDQQWRVMEFDDLGRLISEADEFYDPQTPASGNVIRYLYDAAGRLSQVLDPVQRSTRITYWNETEGGEGAYPGLVKQIKDWRDRQIDYLYDPDAGTLTQVKWPEVANTAGARPAVKYSYLSAGGDYSSQLELRSNLESITDPQQVAGGGAPRVKLTYDTGSDFKRDHVLTQKWGTGETASFTWNSRTSATVTDALGQSRDYTLTEQPKNAYTDRSHIQSIVESGVTTSSTAFGQLPASVTAQEPPAGGMDRTFSFSYDADGQVLSDGLGGVRTGSYSYQDVRPTAPGSVLTSVTSSGAGAAVTEQLAYQSGANSGTFLRSRTINGATVNVPEPHRGNREIQATNDSISSVEKFDITGLLTNVNSSGGTDGGGGGSQATVSYAPASDGVLHRRSEPTQVDEGSGVVTRIDYPSRDVVVETDARGVATRTEYDSWRRPVHVTVTGPQLSFDERYDYDASGHLVKHTHRQGGADVTTTYGYDVMGRRTSISVDNTSTGSVSSSTVYDLPGRRIVTTLPGGATRTSTIDGLGRTIRTATTTGSGTITDYFAYDLDGNLVFRTDLQTATAWAYDANHQVIGEAGSDGSSTEIQVDGWGRPTAVRRSDAGGAAAGESIFDYAPAGSLRSITSKADGARTRQVQFAWDGGGRTTGVSVAGRATHSQYDTGGRLTSAATGEGQATAVTTPYDQLVVSGHAGWLPQQIQKSEKGGGAYAMALQYNAAADVTDQTVGDLSFSRRLDQDGNVVSVRAPNRAEHALEYDSRGLLERETLPGGGVHEYSYDASGGLTGYKDPADEVTQTVTDSLGRPTRRSFQDGTSESIEWQGRRVGAFTDRRGRRSAFTYNAKGQITEIAHTGGAVETIAYDDAGRIVRWANQDAVVEYSDFDFDGHPTKTSQTRLRGGQVVDKYTQQHGWNVHGERTSWTMPAYDGFSASQPWTSSVTQQYDAMGNVVEIQRTAGGTASSTLLTAGYRNTGRPDRRTVTAAGGAQINRQYGFNAGNGLLDRLTVISRGFTVSGSALMFDGVQRARAQLLGVSGGARADRWTYDQRSRLATSLLARDETTPPAEERLTAADFRTAFIRRTSSPVEPPSITFTESSGGHQIATVTRGSVVEQFTFTGGERTEDGRFRYEYDDQGRLIAATEKPAADRTALRRIRYAYAPAGRVVGRLAEFATVQPGQAPAAGDWQRETRPDVLAADALPADTTFVWDPISDTLVAAYKTGSSQGTGIDANGGLIRQIIGGGLGYDDPVEIAAMDGTRQRRLYPIFDEAGSGSLQVILDEQAKLVARSLAGGPYGEYPSVLFGPAVDKIVVKTDKDSTGEVIEAAVEMRLTEIIDPATLATGARLAAVDINGDVVRLSSVEPVLDGESTVVWTLNKDQWKALLDPLAASSAQPVALSIAATSSLRAAAWADGTRVMPAPKWALDTMPVHSTSELPMEVRESFSSLGTTIEQAPTGETSTTLFEVPSLLSLGVHPASVGSPQMLVMSAAFKALPFYEPATGMIYARARWYDPSTGTFFSPDPQGYTDSSNLYAFCGGDPVNCNDPSGLQGQSQLSWIARMAQSSTAIKGAFGERALEIILMANNRVIIEGPRTTGKGPNEAGADIITYNKATREVEFWDSKYFTRNRNVGSASTLELAHRMQANMRRAEDLIEGMENSDEMLDALRQNRIRKIVGAVGRGNEAAGVTARLSRLGIEFGDLAWIRRTGISRQAIVRQARRLAGRVAKKIVIAGFVLSFVMDAQELSAAEAQDAVFADIVSEYRRIDNTVTVPSRLMNENVIRSAIGIIGEEGGALGGGILGAAGAGLLGLPSGPGAVLTAAAGGVGGGIAGGKFGRWLGNTVSSWIIP